MAINTAEGVRVPSIGDDYALTADLRLMAESIDGVVPVANKVARSALIAAQVAAGRPPTPTSPTVVVRGDAVGDPIEVTEDGTNFTAGPTVYVQGGNAPATGQTPPAGTRTLIQAFPVFGATTGSGTLDVNFPVPFAAPPIIHATTISGGGINPVIDSGVLTATSMRLAFPTLPSTSVFVHITAIGWVAE